jgi:hypothetical protein
MRACALSRVCATPSLVRPLQISVGMTLTALQIQNVLLQTPQHERIAVAARLIASALADDDLDAPGDSLPDDRDLLMAHLRGKLGR